MSAQFTADENVSSGLTKAKPSMSESVFDAPPASASMGNLASPAGSIHLPMANYIGGAVHQQNISIAQAQLQIALNSDVLANAPSRSDTGGGMRPLWGLSQAGSIVNVTNRQRATSTQDAGEQRPAGSDGDTIEMAGTGGSSAAALGAVQELQRSHANASHADRFDANAGSPHAAVHAPAAEVSQSGASPNGGTLPAGHSAGNISAETEGQPQRQGASQRCPASPAASTARRVAARPESRLSHDVSAYAAPAAVSASGVDYSGGDDRGGSGRRDSLSGVFRCHHEPEPQPAACTVPLQPPPGALRLPLERGCSGPDRRPSSRAAGDAGPPDEGEVRGIGVPRSWCGVRCAQSDGEVQGLPTKAVEEDDGGGRVGDAWNHGIGEGRANAIIGDGIGDAKDSTAEVRQQVGSEEIRPEGERGGHGGESTDSREEGGRGGGCPAMRADAIIRVGLGDEGEEEVQAAASSPKQAVARGRNVVPGITIITTAAASAQQGVTDPVGVVDQCAAVSASKLPVPPWRLRSCNGSVCAGSGGYAVAAACAGTDTGRASEQGMQGAAGCTSGAREAILVPRVSESGSQNHAQLERRDSESEACHGSAGQPLDPGARQEGTGEAEFRYEGEGEVSLAERNATRGSCGEVDGAEWPHIADLSGEAPAPGFGAMRSGSSAGAPLLAAAAATSAWRSSPLREGVGEFRGAASPTARPKTIVQNLFDQSRNLSTRSRAGSVELPALSALLTKDTLAVESRDHRPNGSSAPPRNGMWLPATTAEQPPPHHIPTATARVLTPATSGSSPQLATAPPLPAPASAGIGAPTAGPAGSPSVNAFLAATGGFVPHQAVDGRPALASPSGRGFADMQQLPPGTLQWLQRLAGADPMAGLLLETLTAWALRTCTHTSEAASAPPSTASPFVPLNSDPLRFSINPATSPLPAAAAAPPATPTSQPLHASGGHDLRSGRHIGGPPSPPLSPTPSLKRLQQSHSPSPSNCRGGKRPCSARASGTAPPATGAADLRSRLKNGAAAGVATSAVAVGVVSTGAAPLPLLHLGSRPQQLPQTQPECPQGPSPFLKHPGNHVAAVQGEMPKHIFPSTAGLLLATGAPLPLSSPHRRLQAALQLQHLMVNLGVNVEQAQAALDDILRALSTV